MSRSRARALVVTVSDRSAAGVARDLSGPALRRKLIDLYDMECPEPVVVADDVEAIQQVLHDAVAAGVELVVTTGGTGIGARDATPEALRRVTRETIPGFGELMRLRSSETTPMAWLSRCTAGAAGRTLIVCVPGSPSGAVESIEHVRELIPHALRILSGEVAHPETDADR